MNLKGYVAVGSPVPVSVQNMVVRDYCARNGHSYSLSDVEFVFGGSAMFTGIDWSAFDGVCAYSMFLMPEALTVPYGKQIHFALEGYVYPQDKEILETIWAMKRL